MLDLNAKLKKLMLPRFMANYQNLAIRFEGEQKSFVEYLEALSDLELEHRQHARIQRLLKNAKMPRSKSLESFDLKGLPNISLSQINELASGNFIDRAENLLLFGNPGMGKTHLCLSLIEKWCLQGRKVLYYSSAVLIQELLLAKKDYTLPKLLKRLDRFDILVIDDISYIPCNRDETDVLFTVLAERYERRSLLITSNLVFNDWNKIFKDDITTVAVIDRLIHYATILEMNGESYRMQAAKKRQIAEGKL